MKVKQSPDDFRVEELSDVSAGTDGEFSFYRLTKTGWTTVDAIDAIRRRWEIDRRRISYGGLKDRHAETSQFVTIHFGPERGLEHHQVRVEYLGKVPHPFAAADIRANRFTITLRALEPAEAERAGPALDAAARAGIPNYFDDQRFGSVGFDDQFVAGHMVRGEYEKALWQAIVAANSHDRGPAKREKATLRAHWGDWAKCKSELPKCHARSLVDYLVSHPADFRGAVARLRPELRGLYLSAYQSHLWNRTLARWLTAKVPADDLSMIQLRMGPHPIPDRMPADRLAVWENLEIPLASARMRPDASAEWSDALDAVLREEGLELSQIKVRAFDRPYFTRGERAACVRPTGLEHEVADDERNAGRRKLRMSFTLPRGCYATMLIKRVQNVVGRPVA